MNLHRTIGFASCLLVLCGATSAWAQVGDATIQTDHPLYPGEGALQSVEDCVKFATEGKRKPQEQAIALYNWMLTHQFHLASPQGWFAPGKTPDTERSDDDLIVFDANQARFSFAYGLCGTVHAWNEPYWRALGMNARRRAFPGHVNSEVFYGGGWHAFDTDMAGLVFRRDGVVAGYDDLVKQPLLAEAARPPVPCYPFAWPSDFRSMQQGWREVAKKGPWYAMYNSGFAAEPGIVALRRGETFTRWFDRDHWGGPSKRRFWHHLPGGPQRNWTFVNEGPPEHRGAESNTRGNASYCNGEFVYRPDLSGDAWRDGALDATANVAGRSASPRLHSSDGKAASVVFSHHSPYVICGDPEDDTNPMTGRASDGFVVSGAAVGRVRLDLSVDGGQSWQELGEVEGRFRRDLTELTKGRYGWQVRLRLEGASGLDEIEFDTVTQVAQPIYPRLKPGGSRVVYRAGQRGVIPVLPDFGLPEEALARIEKRSLRSANVAYKGRRASRQAYETTNNKPGHVVLRIDAPRELVEVTAAFRYPVRVPPPEGCDFHMEVSTDDGKSWRLCGKAEIPPDNEFSSGWVYGKADVSTAKAKSALVRMHFYGGGYRTGVMDARLYGIYRTTPPSAVEIEYGWREGNKSKTHIERVPADAVVHRFNVSTGEKIVDEFVRLTAR